MTDALIKPMTEMTLPEKLDYIRKDLIDDGAIQKGSAWDASFTEAIQALSAPGDAERERLARWAHSQALRYEDEHAPDTEEKFRRIAQLLCVPTDAEKEELAKWCEIEANTEDGGGIISTRYSDQMRRLVRVLRSSAVAWKVTDEMVERAEKAWFDLPLPRTTKEQHARFRAALEAALNVSQPGVK